MDEVEHEPPPFPYPASLSFLSAAMLFSKTPSPRWASVPAWRNDGSEAVTSTLRRARYATRSACPGSASTVRLQRSMIRRPSFAASSTRNRNCGFSSGRPR